MIVCVCSVENWIGESLSFTLFLFSLVEMLEELFGAAVIEEKVEKKVTKEVILLDPKRWQNLCMQLLLILRIL